MINLSGGNKDRQGIEGEAKKGEGWSRPQERRKGSNRKEKRMVRYYLRGSAVSEKCAQTETGREGNLVTGRAG